MSDSEVKFPAGPGALGRAAELAGKLQEAVAETRAEIDKLPAFFRPLAQNWFREKSGQSIMDWERGAVALTERLHRMAAADAAAWAEFQAGYPQFRELLIRLGDCCRAASGGLASFTKDQEKLELAARIADQREALLRSLVAVLDEIQS